MCKSKSVMHFFLCLFSPFWVQEWNSNALYLATHKRNSQQKERVIKRKRLLNVLFTALNLNVYVRMYPIPHAISGLAARVKNTGKKCTRAKRKQRRQSSFTTYPRSRIGRAVIGDIVAFEECYSTRARVLCARNKTVCAYLSFSMSLWTNFCF